MRYLFGFSLVLVALFYLCLNTQAQVQNKAYGLLLKGMYKKTVPTINVTQLKQAQNKVVLLDTRETKEYNISHLSGAICVGYEHFDVQKVLLLDPQTPIVVYCSVGYRSERIGERLLAMGFTNVRNLYGGVFEWINQKGILVDNEQQTTQRIHAYDKKWGVWLQNGKKVYE